MRRVILLFLAGILLVSTSALAQPKPQPDTGFNRFLEQFRTAVEQRDQKKLATMMSPKFDFFRATGVSPSAAFQGLAADNGKQWANLEAALLHRQEAQKGARRV